MKIWDVSIRQPVFMTMVLAAGVIMGIFSYFRMPVDVFPNVEFPIVVVITVYPGAGPEEVEDQVTKKLEAELSTIGGAPLSYSSTSISQRTRRAKRCAKRSTSCATNCPLAFKSR
jgi:multidrug efflux pump subunit AcrB